MITPKFNYAPLDKDKIRFYDNYVPTLPVGDYMIDVEQRVNPKNTSIDDKFETSQRFFVQGPRYTLPTEDIFSVFPPDNAEGNFHQSLPHVVLAKRDLPWERHIFNDGGKTPWMALLLFVEGEKLKGFDTLLCPKIESWKKNPAMTAVIPASEIYNEHNDNRILWPELVRKKYESEGFLKETMCSVIDISPQAFSTLVPKTQDLAYLAHVRQVNPSSKDSCALKVCPDGWYSVIVGNRLPDAAFSDGTSGEGKRNIVHLVSLEGLDDYVNGNKSIPECITNVRMISFKSWTFKCLPKKGESFSGLMNNLIKDTQGVQKSTNFALPVKVTNVVADEYKYAGKALEIGYVPLSYQTRQGEQTFAWYRGPFSPVPVVNFTNLEQSSNDSADSFQPFNTSSSAIIYDEKMGVFDLSYGVAWEVGRLMAMSDAHFGQELIEWQQKGHHLVDLILERRAQTCMFKNFDPENPCAGEEMPLAARLKSYSVTDSFIKKLITGFSQQMSPKLNLPPPSPSDVPVTAFADSTPVTATVEFVTGLLQEPEVLEIVRSSGAEEMNGISDWLGRLQLLEGVPFENLLPHPDLLLGESVRFFYIDPNWLEAIMEGALSIGVQSSRDLMYQNLMKDIILEKSFATAMEVRDSLLGINARKCSKAIPATISRKSMTGMLLRSSVVSGWPGLEINAYANLVEGDIDKSSHIKPLRIERLSPDVLLGIWPAVPAAVTIDEPHDGIAFGFEDPPEGNGYCLYLRSLDSENYGKPLGDGYKINAGAIITSERTIKISAAGGLLEAIKEKLPGKPAISIRDFALQMVRVPEQAVFASKPVKNSLDTTMEGDTE